MWNCLPVSEHTGPVTYLRGTQRTDVLAQFRQNISMSVIKIFQTKFVKINKRETLQGLVNMTVILTLLSRIFRPTEKRRLTGDLLEM
jgi:tellurite resistance protein